MLPAASIGVAAGGRRVGETRHVWLVRIPDRPVVQPVSFDAIERPRARLVIKPPATGRDFELIPQSLALKHSKNCKTDCRCHAILSFARGRFLAAGTK